mmetsp:Transcript_329/g.606  ORF Transcript_329/g.606 Transcript_329/m.606 type:complete len:135 (+) Transcript_329:152-556(+)
MPCDRSIIKQPDGPQVNRGVGIVCHPDSNGQLFIHSLSTGGPAERSGQVMAGDLLFSINGTEVTGLHVSMVAPLLAGEPGSIVRLGLLREAVAEPIYVSLRRGWFPPRSQPTSASSAVGRINPAAGPQGLEGEC